MEGKIIVMLGAPGAGKGTQARQLQDKYSLPQISTGDILRAMAKSENDLGRQIRETQAAGKLVSDDILAEVVSARTNEADCSHGYILDGYPRTLNQAAQLEELAKKQERHILVINVEVEHDLLMKRLTGRRTCSGQGCGEIYNIYFKAPKSEGVCDLCGSALGHRSDDQPEAIKKRLDEYHKNTSPLIDHYKNSHCLVSVDGTKDPDEVFAELSKAVSA